MVAHQDGILGVRGSSPLRSTKKLARLSDVANNTIIKIEAGKNQNPTLNTLKKISKALEVSVDELIQ